MQSVIVLNNLQKSYDKVPAINGITCEVRQGEIFGLLGPSGAGKTTIINILTGQLDKSGGEATLLGSPASSIPEHVYAQVGMMLDSSGVYKRLTVFQNLDMFADIYGIDKQYIKEVLAKVGLTGNEKKP